MQEYESWSKGIKLAESCGRHLFDEKVFTLLASPKRQIAPVTSDELAGIVKINAREWSVILYKGASFEFIFIIIPFLYALNNSARH